MKVNRKLLTVVSALVLVGCGGEIKKGEPGNNSSVNNQTANNLVANNTSTNSMANNVSVNNTTMPPNNVNNTTPLNNVNNTTPPNNVNNTTMPPNNVNNTTMPPNNMTNNGPGPLPIHVQLTWNTANSDLDVHVAHELATQDVNQPDLDMNGVPDPWLHPVYDCNWRNKAPDWGMPGPQNDPSEDIDDVAGLGPENVNIDDPESGVTYHVAVRYFADQLLDGPTGATVRIFVGGMLVEEFDATLASPRDLWEVATVTGDGVVTPIAVDGEPKVIINYSPDL